MNRWEIDFDKRKTRPPVKQKRIIGDLSNRILCGEYAQGTNLPTRAELEVYYKVSPITLQRAMDQLTALGMVESNSRGTVVSSCLPHNYRYGLVFPSRDTRDFPWGFFFHALRRAASEMEQTTDLEFPIFYCGEHAGADNRDYRMLEHVVDVGSIAGLFLLNPYFLQGTPVLKQKDVPLVTYTPCNLPEAPALVFDYACYAQQAMSWFRKQGCRRPAMITTGQIEWDTAGNNHFRLAAEANGLELRPEWVQSVPLYKPRCARNTAHLLFANPNDRPDALLIADDNLVEAAGEGLLAAGVRSPEDVTVIAHCNFPYLPKSPVSLSWLGFDSRKLLEHLITVVRRCRAGTIAAAEQTLIPSRFDALDEYEESCATVASLSEEKTTEMSKT